MYAGVLAQYQLFSDRCIKPRDSTLGFYEADDFVKTRWKFVSFYF
jgi:hypothetical protein